MRPRILGNRLAQVIAALGAVVLIAVGLGVFAVSWHPAIKTYPIQGVDVSQAQGQIDWNMLAARGADFAYVRATNGGGERDQRFAENWRGALDAGLRRGAIHRWSFCQRAVDQANNFITTLPRSTDALPAVLDLDFSPDCDARPDRAALIGELTTFLRMAETHTGEPMLLKISDAVAKAYHPSQAIGRPIWAARNFFAPDYAARPWKIWQASDIRRIDGVSGPVNWDVIAP